MPINTTNQILPTQQTILIVEDEFAVANDLQQILEKAGYRISGIAFTVAKAIELKNQLKPDLVLLDILLKGEKTGIDLARILAEENIPFIYVSANTNSSILEEVKTTQPYGFIVKPFREKDVLIALEIAHYRHAHRIEVRVRQEQALQIALTDAFSGNDPWEDRLLKVTSLFQEHIPFDYFIIGFEKNHLVDAYRSCSFFRIGKEEYQTIWIENFLQMTGLTLEKYQAIQEQIPDITEAIYNGKEFEELCRRNPIKQLISKTFNMQSNLIIPLKTATNGTFFLSFFSRQPSTFLKEHLYILERLRPSLALTVDRLMAFDQIQLLSEQLDQENKCLQEEVKTGANFEEMIGESSALVNVFKSISQVAPTDYTVLILGETGTGKELIARAVHNRSTRKGKTLIKVNCAALPPQLIESELFGHEKGSFTGAIEKRIGKFELAHGGTIFLDEIGELPIELQAKLLRVLQEKEIERLGGKGPISLDVRIIAATNRNLQEEITAGRFRSDLYYRLNVFPIKLPPLRERNEDLMPLAMHFLKKISKKLGKSLTGISESTKQQMLNYHWPGNIRELEHLLERAAIMATSPVISLVEPLLYETSYDADLAISEPPSVQLVKPHMKAEKDNILKALNISNFRIRGKGGAAELLDVKPTTLEAKMARLGIHRNR
ncbi:transcriptional regulator with GAF, ATPase, and Fis domain [Algoriphagus sp. 4150]|uniref:sigma 54-interacting transcriptional regulator n=1 Tax=Algoriphagus sp. 4150 TaxID=2817756 RepID=UPI0028613B63|nr:sigma 54-interacting transcriptional regulator [Algoriphagus sp. 4150]MDR7127926.1 transcriptional regulator with GAF, ATPase, and Fis domain [Algoriphagus sp. 4150]